MSRNTKSNNKAELEKLALKMKRTKTVKQKITGKVTKPKSLKRKNALQASTTPNASVTIQKRSVKIKPAA